MVAGVPIVIVEYEPAWMSLFGALGLRLRAELGEVALRIDHIGSTAVRGLAAKPIIDVQVSVRALEPVDAYRGALERCGFVWRSSNTELTKRYFRERPGDPRRHIHVRQAGTFSEQLPLLVRDYLRAHPTRALEYAALKRDLADRHGTDRHAYQQAKEPFSWQTIRLADGWAQQTGWRPGPSDR